MSRCEFSLSLNKFKVSGIDPCNRIHKNLKGEWKSTGDPTEVALQVFATKLGLGRPSLVSSPDTQEGKPRPVHNGNIGDEEKKMFLDTDRNEVVSSKRFELKVEFPFSSEFKRMSTIYVDKTSPEIALVLIKGAVSISMLYFKHDGLTSPFGSLSES